MPKYKAWLVYKQYYKMEFEATSWEEARELARDIKVDVDNPDDYDVEIIDLEEVTNDE